MLFYDVYCAKFGTTRKLIRDDFICCFINQSSIIASQLGYCFQFLAHIAPGIKKIEGCVKN